MRIRNLSWSLFLLLLAVLGACRRESFEEEKQALVGDCPHLEFFRSSNQIVDSYLLEARFLECQPLLDNSSFAYGTEEMMRVIQARRWQTLDGFATCLENVPEFDDPEETDPSAGRSRQLSACLRQVMIRGLKDPKLQFRLRYGAKREPGPEEPIKVRQPEDSRPVRVPAPTLATGGAYGVASYLAAPIGARTASLTTVGQGDPRLVPFFDKLDWDAVCRFTREDFDDPKSPERPAPVDAESLNLMSRECHRLGEKLQRAALENLTARNLALALFEGEELPLFGPQMQATVAALAEGGRGASQETGLVGIKGTGSLTLGSSGSSKGFRPVGGHVKRGIQMREGWAPTTNRADPDEVRTVIRAHRSEVHHCYQKGLVQNARLSGNVRVVFLLNPSGRAQECRVEKNLAIAEVGKCICGRLQTWRFPQPEGGLAKVTYNWTLQPGE